MMLLAGMEMPEHEVVDELTLQRLEGSVECRRMVYTWVPRCVNPWSAASRASRSWDGVMTTG